jgi:hypothetical protein
MLQPNAIPTATNLLVTFSDEGRLTKWAELGSARHRRAACAHKKGTLAAETVSNSDRSRASDHECALAQGLG